MELKNLNSHIVPSTASLEHKQEVCEMIIKYRNIKQVSIQNLSNILEGHLISYPSNCTVDDLVNDFNLALLRSLDYVAPLITRSVSFFMKATGRRLERYHKKTGLTVHREAYNDHVKSYKDALSKAKNDYFSTLIGNQQNQPKQLFSTINRLLCPPDTLLPSDVPGLCSRFQDYFQGKVESIHQQLQQSSPFHSTTLPLLDTNLTTAFTLEDSLSSFSMLNTAQVLELHLGNPTITLSKHPPYAHHPPLLFIPTITMATTTAEKETT
ncbi:unnamed protein product [Leuciscus chuanchicus]